MKNIRSISIKYSRRAHSNFSKDKAFKVNEIISTLHNYCNNKASNLPKQKALSNIMYNIENDVVRLLNSNSVNHDEYISIFYKCGVISYKGNSYKPSPDFLDSMNQYIIDKKDELSPNGFAKILRGYGLFGIQPGKELMNALERDVMFKTDFSFESLINLVKGYTLCRFEVPEFILSRIENKLKQTQEIEWKQEIIPDIIYNLALAKQLDCNGEYIKLLVSKLNANNLINMPKNQTHHLWLSHVYSKYKLLPDDISCALKKALDENFKYKQFLSSNSEKIFMFNVTSKILQISSLDVKVISNKALDKLYTEVDCLIEHQDKKVIIEYDGSRHFIINEHSERLESAQTEFMTNIIKQEYPDHSIIRFQYWKNNQKELDKFYQNLFKLLGGKFYETYLHKQHEEKLQGYMPNNIYDALDKYDECYNQNKFEVLGEIACEDIT